MRWFIADFALSYHMSLSVAILLSEFICHGKCCNILKIECDNVSHTSHSCLACYFSQSGLVQQRHHHGNGELVRSRNRESSVIGGFSFCFRCCFCWFYRLRQPLLWHVGRPLSIGTFTYLLTFWWRFGLVGNVVGRINDVNQRRARLVLGWVTVCRQVNHLGM